jgi:RNA polymerase sigma factor (TIGR02999 family)
MSPAASELQYQLPASVHMPLTDLTPTLYSDLRRIASRHLNGERRNHTLQPTALVHEAYLKLAGTRDQRFADEVHFLAVASRVMRQVLVDYARARAADKRQGLPGADLFGTATLQVHGDSGPEIVDLIALDDALAALGSASERLARLVEMRYFGGMTAEESAEALDLSVHVVRHDLRFAQAWLRRRMRP